MSKTSPSSDFILGFCLLAIGAIMLFTSMSPGDLIRWSFNYWPVFLILVGLYILLKNRWEPTETTRPFASAASNQVDHHHFMGHVDLNLELGQDVAGSYRLTLGDIRVEADRPTLTSGEQILRLQTVLGNIRIRTRRELPIKLSAHISVGDIHLYGQKSAGKQLVYESPSFASSENRLYLICDVVLGDIKIF